MTNARWLAAAFAAGAGTASVALVCLWLVAGGGGLFVGGVLLTLGCVALLLAAEQVAKREDADAASTPPDRGWPGDQQVPW